jgi:hypothetical protein
MKYETNGINLLTPLINERRVYASFSPFVSGSLGMVIYLWDEIRLRGKFPERYLLAWNSFRGSFTGMAVHVTGIWIHTGNRTHEKVEWKAVIHGTVTLVNCISLSYIMEQCYNFLGPSACRHTRSPVAEDGEDYV